jgi:hypothetical protein
MVSILSTLLNYKFVIIKEQITIKFLLTKPKWERVVMDGLWDLSFI